MKELTFRESQLGAYEILKFIDEVCRKNNLTYYLAYGTLIGAIRNHGIIPWDDDIDIMMPRDDYERFVSLFKKQNPILNFKLYDKRLIREYPHPIGRLSDVRYFLDFKNEKDYGLGLFVDIYPLDGLGNDIKYAKKIVHKTSKLASLCFLTSRKHFGRDNTNSLLKYIIKFPAYLVANSLGNDFFYRKLKKYTYMNSYDSSKFIGDLNTSLDFKKNNGFFSKKDFGTIEIDFEDGKYFAPSGYDEILKMLYGDYMTPPPEDQRETHHDYVAYKL